MELENAVDRGTPVQGLRDEAAVRRTRVDGIVGTGAVTLVLPQNVVERLGSAWRRNAPSSSHMPTRGRRSALLPAP